MPKKNFSADSSVSSFSSSVGDGAAPPVEKFARKMSMTNINATCKTETPIKKSRQAAHHIPVMVTPEKENATTSFHARVCMNGFPAKDNAPKHPKRLQQHIPELQAVQRPKETHERRHMATNAAGDLAGPAATVKPDAHVQAAPSPNSSRYACRPVTESIANRKEVTYASKKHFATQDDLSGPGATIRNSSSSIADGSSRPSSSRFSSRPSARTESILQWQ